MLALGGCVANSSSPSVAVRGAVLDDEAATFQLELENPGGRNLAVRRLEYEVSHGESGFPVARGAWTGDLDLPAHGHAALDLTTRLDTPPIEPDSSLLHLSGELFFVDRTGFLGMESMNLTQSPFCIDVIARRGDP